MPAFLILSSCTRVEKPPTCKEVHALTHTTVPIVSRYGCRKNNKTIHAALLYKSQISDTNQRSFPATGPERAYGFLGAPEVGNSTWSTIGLTSWCRRRILTAARGKHSAAMQKKEDHNNEVKQKEC